MICQNCQKRVANVQIVQNINGAQNAIFLCDVCAKNNTKLNVQMPGGFGNFQINLGGFLPGFIGGNFNHLTKTVKKTCQTCGNTFEDFQRTGKLGCGDCYHSFEDELNPVISRIHGNVDHKGKQPGTKMATSHEMSEIDKLKMELREAISKEEYEKAANIRDAIKELEGSEDGK